MLMATYNTGYQALLAMSHGAVALETWRSSLFEALGLPFDFRNPIACALYGALHYVPVVIAAMLTGGIVEPLVAMIRKHEINEGFLVTGMLIPLTLPPTIPLWMVVLGTAFGIVFGKEIFGGTGMNFLNPALTARAFLFFAYPAAMSGDAPWIAANFSAVDSFSGATLLGSGGGLGRSGARAGELDELLPRLRGRARWARPRRSRVCWARALLVWTGNRLVADDGRRRRWARSRWRASSTSSAPIRIRCSACRGTGTR